MQTTFISLFALALGGCAANYAYVPQQNATAQVAGQPAADYSIPPEAPQGDVRVASLGLTRVGTQAGERVTAMHVRMVVANNSATPWTVDAREQLGVIAGEGQVRPIFASTDGGTLPRVEVEPRGKRTIDLFYPLPAGLQKARRLPEFDLLWKVDTGGGRVVAQRTEFDRVEVVPDYPDYYAYGYPYGWAPYAWYDPFYSGYWYRPRSMAMRPVYRR